MDSSTDCSNHTRAHLGRFLASISATSSKPLSPASSLPFAGELPLLSLRLTSVLVRLLWLCQSSSPEVRKAAACRGCCSLSL